MALFGPVCYQSSTKAAAHRLRGCGWCPSLFSLRGCGGCRQVPTNTISAMITAMCSQYTPAVSFLPFPAPSALPYRQASNEEERQARSEALFEGFVTDACVNKLIKGVPAH